MNLHNQLVEKALPVITDYKNDLLVHDKTEIERYPGRRFLHFTGDTGTCMLTLFDFADYPANGERVPYLFGTADRDHVLQGITDSIECMPRVNRMDLILYYDGKNLKATNYERACQIVKDYTASMKRKFRNGNDLKPAFKWKCYDNQKWEVVAATLNRSLSRKRPGQIGRALTSIGSINHKRWRIYHV